MGTGGIHSQADEFWALANGCPKEQGLVSVVACSDGCFRAGEQGVQAVLATRDGKVEFIQFADRVLAYVKSALGYAAYYPLHPVALAHPVQAVLMDLDGTTVRSEGFWINMLERTVRALRGDADFRFAPGDQPYVAGHSISEHLQYCLRYCPGAGLDAARACYHDQVRGALRAIAEGDGSCMAFAPAPGLKAFLLGLKEMGVKVGLVTSGLYEKAWPEILSAFRAMGMGDPRDFYDAIITAGQSPRHREPGTLGELECKPHPWLYAETGRIGLGIDFAERNAVVGIEDSGAGVIALRLAGFPTIGLAGGNVVESGTRGLCQYFCNSLGEAFEIIRG
jgi:beta-phosphoglucomutase-like phosphatase (HAD superfamily)